MLLIRSLALMVLMIAVVPAHSSEKSNQTDPVLHQCLVSIINEAEVPAQESGVLIKLEAREGMHVLKDSLLGRIDDSERQLQKTIALLELDTAKELAKSDINVRSAKAAANVSQAEYLQSVEANKKVKGTFPITEVRRLKLAWLKADLEIEQSEMEQRIDRHTLLGKAAEVNAAELNIQHRQLRSPLEGEVVSILKHTGEWVAPGDPVVRIVYLEHLRVEGFLDVAKYHPADVAGSPVVVRAKLTQNQEVEFEGRIVYVSPLIESGGEYRVWAEVKNRKARDQWLLMPGLTVTMTIRTNQPATHADTLQTFSKIAKPPLSGK